MVHHDGISKKIIVFPTTSKGCNVLLKGHDRTRSSQYRCTNRCTVHEQPTFRPGMDSQFACTSHTSMNRSAPLSYAMSISCRVVSAPILLSGLRSTDGGQMSEDAILGGHCEAITNIQITRYIDIVSWACACLVL
ncbi:hypothetical protein BD309DRAFT_575205 [Dichomitus squalens]|uniref:Uncharacterized protein n=1 Tax=Dichomitus squalens TaxID=114155 RepID=A0A4Q9QEE3_9APHY|nr:hypothetical protein BD309DRAFT_575205 [Dichomitus squalens]TBU66119.1 hypothetical protein BD310DRAFT_943574 [Dichomitus squalens]